MKKITSSGAILVLSLLALTACGLKPAQDYVAIGTLQVAPPMQRFVAQRQFGNAPTELVMSLRTSPDVKDVVIQRRWINPTFPLEFGLGKGRGAELAGKKFWITAELRGLQSGSLVGWTEDLVPAGTYFVEFALQHQAGDPAIAALPGSPTGGYESSSVREEAAPPGHRPVTPGAMVFSGRIELPEGYAAALAGRQLRVIARERAERGAPELVIGYDHPRFPLGFALHQNHRLQALMGKPEEAVSIAAGDPITTPKFVVAQIDLDGSVDTKEDMIEAVTEQQVVVGSNEIVLRFKAEDIARALEAVGSAASAHGGGPTNPHGEQPRVATPAAGSTLAKGRVVLPDALKDMAQGAELWLSIRDPKSQSMMDAYRVQTPSFPHEFDLEVGKGMMQTVLAADQPFLIRAILSTDGPMSKTALIAVSGELKPGSRDLVLELAPQAN